MLLYIDPEDTYSNGTALHRLLPRGEMTNRQTSYLTNDIDWRTDVAMGTFRWNDPRLSDRQYQQKVSDYKANRLFVFLDGPLALHSVPFDNPDRLPDPARALDGGRHARRRILRSHIKVHEVPFYAKHSSFWSERIEPERYLRVMAPNPVLSDEDQRYSNTVIHSFFKERLLSYARAVDAVGTHQAIPTTGRSRFWDGLFGRRRPSYKDFIAQLANRVP